MCVFFLALSPYRKTMRDGKSASKPNPHIFAQLSRMRKQLAACCKKLFLKVDKIAVKKLGKTPVSAKGRHRKAPYRQDACIPMRVRYAADIDLSMAAKSQERDPEQRCADEG